MPFHSDIELKVELSPGWRHLVLSLFPAGTTICDSVYFDNFDLPCPIRVRLRLPDGELAHVVLRSSRHGDTPYEAELLRTLGRLGLAVPGVLAETGLAADSEPRAIVLSLLPGTDLQSLSMESPEGLEEAQRLLIEAITQLANLTDVIEQEPVGRLLPRTTLAEQLESVASFDSPWLREPAFQAALSDLRPILRSINTALVFSNGDYQPGNFLAEHGRLTGFLDFESACFQDPLFGIAKYPIYDLHPQNKAGFVPAFLAATGWSAEEFAPRLALACLITLRREIPLTGGDGCYRKHVLRLLHDSLGTAKDHFCA